MSEDSKGVDRKNLLKDFGERFLELLEEYGFTQSEVAELCDKDRQTVNKMVKGEYNPSIVFLKFINLRTGIPVERMVEILDSKPYDISLPIAAEGNASYGKKNPTKQTEY